ncbi:hypothetical protein DBT_1842 [Dissulfuribacter thermophilus]|uniref:Uncharacterized protein n=2 Tax=Dissulfuribacter thermophilus TaxID=1156395 RepID=A0A1B9F4D0_9BACT|nr:hypothetical protein DBT_1842 [Dissulfuribacter thermophilus]
MSSHRNISVDQIEIHPAISPSSSFDFVESYFKGIDSTRCCFSLARSLGMQTITLEKLPAHGLILEENNELKEYFPDYEFKEAIRLCFWKPRFQNQDGLQKVTSRNLIGYAILKHDVVSSKKFDRWHIFEAVFKKYPHPHNYVARPKTFQLACGNRRFSIKGILYCQQNSLNKACAQVAIRSLLANHLSHGDISYKKINELAGVTPDSGREPGKGLAVIDIRKEEKGTGALYSTLHKEDVSA